MRLETLLGYDITLTLKPDFLIYIFGFLLLIYIIIFFFTKVS